MRSGSTTTRGSIALAWRAGAQYQAGSAAPSTRHTPRCCTRSRSRSPHPQKRGPGLRLELEGVASKDPSQSLIDQGIFGHLDFWTKGRTAKLGLEILAR